ncbi:MAG: GNAT family N-acetyltransferase [Burkholderiales bacterium]
MNIAIHNGYLPGCIGRVAELHARYYHQLTGFGVHFEAKVARELAEFCERYDGHRDGLWLAVENDVVEGSIAIDGSHADQDGAHLRWFITSAQVRGMGIGNTLLAEAMAYCRSQRYDHVYLWTFDGLGAARHLYEKFGFRLVHQQRGRQWGSEVDEQRFELQD